MEKIGRCDLVGGGGSLGAGFEVPKAHSRLRLSLSGGGGADKLRLRCETSATVSFCLLFCSLS